MMRRAPVKTDVTDAERVGFIVPCYGGGLPGDVESYLDSIKISPSAYTFAVGQYAGYLGCGLHKINERFELDPVGGSFSSVLVHLAVPASAHAAARNSRNGAEAQ